MADRKTAVPSAQCWYDGAIDRTQDESDRTLSAINAFNHTENALLAARARIEALEALAIQYRDDLRHPPSGDSLDRRLEAVNTLLSDSETGENEYDTIRPGESVYWEK